MPTEVESNSRQRLRPCRAGSKIDTVDVRRRVAATVSTHSRDTSASWRTRPPLTGSTESCGGASCTAPRCVGLTRAYICQCEKLMSTTRVEYACQCNIKLQSALHHLFTQTNAKRPVHSWRALNNFYPALQTLGTHEDARLIKLLVAAGTPGPRSDSRGTRLFKILDAASRLVQGFVCLSSIAFQSPL